MGENIWPSMGKKGHWDIHFIWDRHSDTLILISRCSDTAQPGLSEGYCKQVACHVADIVN